MSARQTMKDIWEAVTSDPNILAGTVQVIVGLVGLLLAAITRKKIPTPTL